MGPGNGRDDGQAEAEAVVVGGPLGGQALERLEKRPIWAAGMTGPVLVIVNVERPRSDVT